MGVGSDYYGFLALPEGRLGIAIGDVSGKGIVAALMMASLQASLGSEAMNSADEEWGESCLIDAIKASDTLCSSKLIEQIMKDADAFAAGASQHDDKTLVVLRCV